MNISLLNGGVFDWILAVLGNIPRFVYFLFACLTSGVDALQCLIRKLAGLDSYWVQDVTTSGSNAVEVTGRDPLTEFIYGILGIGSSSTAYKALNTVFWSLSIFALIVLALSTMIAMIKSHYSEDYQNTNPWKYIYTAIKAVLTYAIMPVIVVIGLELSSFILITLDNVTSGTSSDKVVDVYGANVVRTKFEGVKDKKTNKTYYTHYDFFGAGLPTSNQTFGGMLFNAAAYSSNRARKGSITLDQLEATGIFANSSSPQIASMQSDNEKLSYAAYQIDYAFSNNIQLTNSISVDDLKGWFPDVIYVRGVDFFTGLNISSFSKYEITAVWMFYDLWQFNLIVGFGGAISTIGILLSIIVGLMSRLIQGAALFLVYPTMLSLSPLDNFKAFKAWGTKFLQQIIMAYGAIVGINILMLILPYVQGISFFGTGTGLGALSAIINMIILIVGLLMTKDFIATVSGFIGGADASSAGEGLKGGITSFVKSGASKTVKAGAGIVRAQVAAGRLIGSGFKGAVNGVKHIKDRGNKRALDYKEKFDSGRVLNNEINKLASAIKEGKESDLSPEEKAIAQLAEEARTNAKSGGASDKDADAAARAAAESLLKTINARDKDGNVVRDRSGAAVSMYDDLEDKEKRYEAGFLKGKDTDKHNKKLKRAEKVTEKMESGKLKYERGAHGYYHKSSRTFKEASSDRWQVIKAGAKGVTKALHVDWDAKDAGKQLADSFLKTVSSVSEGTGVDKMIGGLKGIFQSSWTMKGTLLDPKPEGDALQKKNAEDAKKSADSQLEQTKQTNALLKQLVTDNK